MRIIPSLTLPLSIEKGVRVYHKAHLFGTIAQFGRASGWSPEYCVGSNPASSTVYVKTYKSDY